MEKYEIKPFGDQILIEPITKKQTLISDQKSLCEYGEVIAIGDEVKKIKVGQKIGFLIWGLNSLELNGKKYYFCQETPEFILGVIEVQGDVASSV